MPRSLAKWSDSETGLFLNTTAVAPGRLLPPTRSKSAHIEGAESLELNTVASPNQQDKNRGAYMLDKSPRPENGLPVGL